MKHSIEIGWIAIRELLYEKVFYLLVLFAMAAVGLSFLLGKLTYSEHAKLTLDFMLGGIHVSMILFSVFMGISLLHREMQWGSIAMVLSKPISRATFLLGKYLGQVTVQGAVMAAMAAITLAVCPDGPEKSTSSILQCLTLSYLEVLVVTAVTYVCAVNTGAVTAAMASLCVYLLGHFSAQTETIKDTTEKVAWTAVKSFVPNLEVFNTRSLASYGLSIPGNEVGLTFLYCGILVVLFLSIAVLTFERKDILT